MLFLFLGFCLLVTTFILLGLIYASYRSSLLWLWGGARIWLKIRWSDWGSIIFASNYSYSLTNLLVKKRKKKKKKRRMFHSFFNHLYSRHWPGPPCSSVQTQQKLEWSISLWSLGEWQPNTINISLGKSWTEFLLCEFKAILSYYQALFSCSYISGGSRPWAKGTGRGSLPAFLHSAIPYNSNPLQHRLKGYVSKETVVLHCWESITR